MFTRFTFILFAGLFIPTLAQAQKVGVGTANPQEKLHVMGTILSESALPEIALRQAGLPVGSIQQNGNNTLITNLENGSMVFRTNNQSHLFLRNNGSLGLGVSTPLARFHLTGAIRIDESGDNPANIQFAWDGETSGAISADTLHMFLKNESSGDIRLYTSGQPRMNVDSTGNVGIGTLTPQSLLHVKGSARIEDAETPRLTLYQGATYAAFIQSAADILSISNKKPGNIQFYTNDNARMAISYTGNVGVGTTSPTSKMHIVGETTIEDAGTPRLRLFQGNTFAAFIQSTSDMLSISNKKPGNIQFYTNDNARMAITNTGKVGIGTISPQNELHVLGVARIEHGGTPQLRFHQGNDFAAFIQSTGDIFSLSNKLSGNIQMHTNDLVRLSITNAGNVGIGTTNPQNELHVVGTARIEDAGTPRLSLYQGNTFAGFIQSTSDILSISNKKPGNIQIYTNDIPRIAVTNGGLIGLGTTAPADKLHILGDVRVDDAVTPELKFYKGATHAAGINSAGNNFQIENELPGSIHFNMNNITRVTIANNGNMGIGTTVPLNNLHVVGAARIEAAGTPQLRFHQGDVFSAFLQTSSDDFFISNKLGGRIKLLTNDLARLEVKNSGDIDMDGTTLHVDASTNRVGVGTYNPEEALEVNGNIQITGDANALQFNSNIDIAEIKYEDGGLKLFTKVAGHKLGFYTNGDDTTPKMVVKHDGRVGIGTETPGADLQVQGSMWVDGITLRVLDATNQVLIGGVTPAAGYSLCVNGKAIVEELKVQLDQNWPDYVFDNDYKLLSLSETKSFIDQHGHLPGIPSADEISTKEGFEVGEMQRLLLEKVEELTLHVISLQEEIDRLKNDTKK